MEYISCFSGIGGLEATRPPIVCSETDEHCVEILRRRFPKSRIWGDIASLPKISAPVVVGGWPCQDISVAGRGRGLVGPNSKLFFQLMRVASSAGAHTIVAENVPNLLRMKEGAVFSEILHHFHDAGYNYVAWRELNVREFDLPHQRRRVLLVASTKEEICLSVHRDVPSIQRSGTGTSGGPQLNAFYWTAGTQGLCYSPGYIPTLKVGSSLSIPSPPALHLPGRLRLLSASDALRLQGFDPKDFENVRDKHLFRMAGNAVARPVGQFVVDGVLDRALPDSLHYERQPDLFSNDLSVMRQTPKSGCYLNGELRAVKHERPKRLAGNLDQLVDFERSKPLSRRAISGLLRRLSKSSVSCPTGLKADLQAVVKVEEGASGALYDEDDLDS